MRQALTVVWLALGLAIAFCFAAFADARFQAGRGDDDFALALRDCARLPRAWLFIATPRVPLRVTLR